MNKILIMAVVSALTLSPQAMAAQTAGADRSDAAAQGTARDAFNVQVPDRTMDLVLPDMTLAGAAGNEPVSDPADRDHNVQVPAETMAAVVPQMNGTDTITDRLAKTEGTTTGTTETAG